MIGFDDRSGALLLEDGGGVLLSGHLGLGRWSVALVIQIALQLSVIVGELHRWRIIVKNLAPHGLMVDAVGNVQRIDLVLASRLSQESRSGTELAAVFTNS